MSHRHHAQERNRGLDPRRALARGALLIAAAALLATDAAAQHAPVQVTAISGPARQLDTPLALHARVVEGRPLDVEAGARCTLLLAGRTLVRLCGRAEATVKAAGASRPGEIELRAGTLSVAALAEHQEGAFRVHTPAGTLRLLGAGVQVHVAGDGETRVSALDSAVGLPGRDRQDGSEGPTLASGHELSLFPNRGPGRPRAISRRSGDGLAWSSDCLAREQDLRKTLADELHLRTTGLPLVSADSMDASPVPPLDDLLEIVRADFPAEGLPLQPVSAPSALVTELSKRGVDEEVCDPINCNPVYQVDPPGRCGVPPERGCIP